jgi:dihydrofolate synthase/folylpolyglutamate synthase
MFTRMGVSAYKKDLHNTLALLEVLGNPHQKFKSIHIAGTNGKGSTSHMLAAIMHQCGYKTGLYTSPHLYDFRERIKVSGKDIFELCSKDFVVEFTETLKPVIEQIEPSFFEVTVAMAFEWFARQNVDIAIIETGLGGRLDSTNVITPILSIITNIGWDHMNILGDTLQKIAFEKAGIIKNKIPVVIGEMLEETKPIFEKKAADCEAILLNAETHYSIESLQPGLEYISLTFRKKTNGQTDKCIRCDLPGIYQQYNLRTVFTAIDQLRQQGWNLENGNIQQALESVKWITGLGGRWQVIQKKPYVVLDVAHNEAGIQQLLKQISLLQKEIGFNQVHMVIGMVQDKDIDKVLSLLPTAYHYYFTQAQLPRALPYIALKERANAYNLSGDAFPTPDHALTRARSLASENDLIVVCGSVFVVAEVSL